jgi:Fe2+ transport system protein FeoA
VGGLQSFERRLETMISGVFARAFRSAVQPVEISAALQRECDNNAQIISRERRIVPNHFHVELSPLDLDRLSPEDANLEEELTRQLTQYAEDQSYVFPGPVRIEFESADDLTTGRFRIRSRNVAKVTGDHSRTVFRKAAAYLDINGTQHPLQPPGVVVGRGSEAHIRINDPGVSRRHVEFSVVSIAGGSTGGAHTDTLRVRVRDLGSTNGMLVDGHKMATAPLHDGSTVRIGRTDITLRLRQEETEDV